MFAFIGKFLARKYIAQLNARLQEVESQNTINTLDNCRLERNVEKLQEALRQERALRLTVLEAAKNGHNIYNASGFVNNREGTTRFNEFLSAESEDAARQKMFAKYPRNLIGSRVMNITQVASTVEIKLKLEEDPMRAVAEGMLRQMIAGLSMHQAV